MAGVSPGHNIAVKLPATSAGLDVLEDCVAEGSHDGNGQLTVPQY
jgi:transaldolase